MSDVEEPPMKMSKYEENEEYLDLEEEECLEETQEEWLSEGALTDDEYGQTVEQDQEQDKSDVNLPTGQDDHESMETLDETALEEMSHEETNPEEANLEETNLEEANVEEKNLEDSDTIHTTTVIGQIELHDGTIAHASITHGNITQSNVAQSNIAQSNIAQSNITHSNNTQSSLTQSNITQSNITQSNITQSHINQSYITQSNNTQSNLTHSNLTQSNNTHGNISQGNITQNIEEQLNNLERTQNDDELPDDLDAFLIRKTDGQVIEKNGKEEAKKEQEEDDGNDTDDLLRMLSEGNQKVKKKTFKMVKHDKADDEGSSEDDDDDFIYEHSQVKTLKVAKNAIIKRTATKAVPEDMSDGDDETDQSSDEGTTVERMFEVKKAPPSVAKKEPKRIVKHVVHVNTNINRNQKKPEIKLTKPAVTRHKPTILKSAKPTQAVTQKPSKPVELKTPAPFKQLEKPTSKEKAPKSEVKDATSKNDDLFDDLIKEEEFLEEDVSDLDEEEFGEDSEGEGSKKQRIMKPEMMDEEVPSDAESRSEDGSLYDELPSSDSDDLEDWFTLDIRAERAGDYLPLLGEKARDLLLAERRRVSARVATLRQSLSALTDTARRQADQLRSAAMALAEIDDTLRAA